MNVSTLLTRSATRFPDNVALKNDRVETTYRDFDHRVSRLAASIRLAGLQEGSRVAILMRNRPEFLEVLFATFRAGLVAIPIGSRLRRGEIEFIVSHSGCEAIFHGSEVELPANPRANFLTIGPSDYEAFLGSGSVRPMSDQPVESGSPAWLFYTSGTTGQPKGAVLTHGNLVRMVMACLADIADYRPDDVVLHAAPLSHGAGLHSLAAVARSSTHLVPEWSSFDPGEVLRIVNSARVSVISFLTPTMIFRLVGGVNARTSRKLALRLIVYGGGPAYAEDMRRAVDVLGPVFVQLYGQGESPMTITYLPREDHLSEDRLNTVGIPHPDLEVTILDDRDQPLPAGVAGEVCVRGDVIMSGYWADPEATAAALRGGWLRTGDIGSFDRRGYLRLLDRKKELIISGGANIYPREVEDVLLLHPAVKAVAVVGLPDRYWGETVHAVVVTHPDISVDPRELIEFCRGQIASYKKPHSVEFVSELPVSGVGKVLKRELRASAIARRTQEIPHK